MNCNYFPIDTAKLLLLYDICKNNLFFLQKSSTFAQKLSIQL